MRLAPSLEITWETKLTRLIRRIAARSVHSCDSEMRVVQIVNVATELGVTTTLFTRFSRVTMSAPFGPPVVPPFNPPVVPLFKFPSLGGKDVVAAFDGGLITSNGGVILLGRVERRLGIADTLARLIAVARQSG